MEDREKTRFHVGREVSLLGDTEVLEIDVARW
jgi:hypothetical protein